VPIVVSTAAVEAASALISVERYRSITGDQLSDSGNITAALGLALELVEEYLDRQLLVQEHTELLQPYRGKFYPKHSPVLFATGYTIRHDALIGGVHYWGHDVTEDTLTEVTYTGGYDSTTLPTTLQVAIARAAEALIQGQNQSSTNVTVTPGQQVTSIGLGDVRIGYSTASSSSTSTMTQHELPELVRLSIKAYRKRRV
jgi:hypothetical protein